MIRPAFILGAIVLVLGMTGDLRMIVDRDSERAIFAKSCTYYQLRAKSARITRPGEFVVFLADACTAAEEVLNSGNRKQRNRAALLLSRIVDLRDTVYRINAERTIGVAARRIASLNTSIASGTTPRLSNMTRSVIVNPVSPTGEFLIAHRMGVMIAYDALLDSGVTISQNTYQ